MSFRLHPFKTFLKAKLLLLVLGLFIINGFLILTVVHSLTTSSLLNQKKDYLKSLTVDVAGDINEKLGLAQGSVVDLSSDPCTKLFLLGKPITMDINDALTAHLQNGSILESGILDMNGKIIASSDPKLIGTSKNNDIFYKRAIAGQTDVTSFIDFEARGSDYYAYAPVKTDGERTIGVVYERLNTDNMFSALRTSALFSLGDLAIIDSDGIIMYSTNDENELKSLWTLYDFEKQEIAKKYNQTNINIESKGTEVTKDKIEEYNNPQLFDATDTEKQIPETISIARASDYPIFLFVESRTDKVSKATKDITLWLTGIGLTAMIITLAILMLTISYLLGPLKILDRVIVSIGRGNFDQIINIKTNDEFRRLADTIIQMGEELQKKQNINDTLSRNCLTILKKSIKDSEKTKK